MSAAHQTEQSRLSSVVPLSLSPSLPLSHLCRPSKAVAWGYASRPGADHAKGGAGAAQGAGMGGLGLGGIADHLVDESSRV